MNYLTAILAINRQMGEAVLSVCPVGVSINPVNGWISALSLLQFFDT